MSRKRTSLSQAELMVLSWSFNYAEAAISGVASSLHEPLGAHARDYAPGAARIEAATDLRETGRVFARMEREHLATLGEVMGPRPKAYRSIYDLFGALFGAEDADLAVTALRMPTALARAQARATAVQRERLLASVLAGARIRTCSPSLVAERVLAADQRLPEAPPVPLELVQTEVVHAFEDAGARKGGDRRFLRAARDEAVDAWNAAVESWRAAGGEQRANDRAERRNRDEEFAASLRRVA